MAVHPESRRRPVIQHRLLTLQRGTQARVQALHLLQRCPLVGLDRNGHSHPWQHRRRLAAGLRRRLGGGGSGGSSAINAAAADPLASLLKLALGCVCSGRGRCGCIWVMAASGRLSAQRLAGGGGGGGSGGWDQLVRFVWLRANCANTNEVLQLLGTLLLPLLQATAV